MGAHTAIVKRLLATEAVTALVGQNINPATTPHKLAKPNIVYQTISTERLKTKDGPANLVSAYIQLGMWATSYDGATALATAVRESLNGFQGTSGGVNVRYVDLVDEADFETPPEPGSTLLPVYGIRQDYRVWFVE